MRKRYRILGILATFLISGSISSICYLLLANADKSTWDSTLINIMEIGIPIAMFGMFFFTGLVFFIDDEEKRW